MKKEDINVDFDFLFDEISWELSHYDSIEMDPDLLEEKICKFYDNDLEPDDNIRNIYEIISKRYIANYNEGIKKCNDVIAAYKEKLAKSSNNEYSCNLYNKLIKEETEKIQKIQERFEKLDSLSQIADKNSD